MTINADWQRRAEQIFQELLEIGAEGRQNRLMQLCGGNDALRKEVESLLAHSGEDDGLLDRAVWGPTQLPIAPDEHEQLPPKPNAGGYSLLGVVGAGGMGVVYRARQERTKRIVAVKLIRRGLLTPAMLRRFESEAAMLARLHHPGIGQIFEADVADFGHGPQPFIAMELINGRPLIEFAVTHELSTKARLHLMAEVCDAVQHAHQRGVIHRDLKPANILVVERPSGHGEVNTGQPKILDFGVARATDDDVRLTSMRTSVGQLIGTLAYMSPEQVKAEPDEIDTRSDVYTLGVILYELLAGRLPYDVSSRSIPEAARRILEERPTRLSAISRTFRGDIDTIVNKAIEKDPSQRYQSAAEFGADLRRYLNDEPVVARRASAFYAFRKFASRNKKLVGTIVIVALLLFASTITSMIFGLQAKVAQRSAEDATQLAETRRLQAEAEASKSRRSAYLANIAAAEAALEANDVVTANRRLQAVDPANRVTWEWKHFNRQLDGSYARLISPASGCFSVSISNDNRHLATADLDGKVRVWDVESKTSAQTLSSPGVYFQNLAYSPDGRLLACGGELGELLVFESSFGQVVFRVHAHDDYISSLAFSLDGTQLITCSPDMTAKVWDTTTGQLIGSPLVHDSAVTACTFRSDGKQIATSTDNRAVRLWEWPRGGSAAEPIVMRGHRGRVNDLCYSPDGSQLASSSIDRTIRIWDIATHRELKVLRNHRDIIHEIKYAPDGRTLVSASADSTLRIWDVELGVQRCVAHGHIGEVSSVAWSSDGTFIASCSIRDSLRLWDASITKGIDALHGHSIAAYSVAFSPDGKRLASGAADKTVRIWDSESAAEITALRGHEHSVISLLFFADGKRLASASHDHTVRLWDMVTGRVLSTLRGHTSLVHTVMMHPNGQWLASGSDDGSVILWNVETFQPQRRFEHGGYGVRGITFSHDGSQMITVCMDQMIRIWNPSTGELLRKWRGHTAGIIGLTLSPNGLRFATSSDDRSARLWDLASGELLKTFPHPTSVSSVAFTPDGSRLVTGGGDGVVRLWDPEIGDEVAALRGHEYPIVTVAVSPDGSRLATGSLERMVRLWEVKPASDRLQARDLRNRLRERAESVVNNLLAQLNDPVQVAEQLRSDLDDPLRPIALDLLLQESVHREHLAGQN